MNKTTEHLGCRQCDGCPLNHLKEGRRCLELPIKESTVDIMVVGDSPIATELIHKQAFVGHGSMFFKKTFGAVIEQWNKGQDEPIKPKVHFTYATLCHQKQEPPAQAIQKCKPRLLKEIEIKKPRVIIALGNGAMKALGYTKAGILQSRGARKWDSRLDAYVLATFHPQYVLQNTGVFETWTKDLEKALWMLKRPKGQPYEPPKTKVDVLYHVPQAITFLRKLRAKKRTVAADIETRGFRFKYDKLLCMGFTFKAGHAVVLAEEVIHDEMVLKELKKTIESENITWVYHNGKFDNKFFWAQYGIKARTDIDTMLMHYCIDVRKGTHDLEQVAMEYCDAEPWEHEAHKYVKESFADIPRPILYKYQGIDTDMTFRVLIEMNKLFDAERKRGRKIDKLFKLLSDASNAYMRLELNGFKADLNYVEKLAQEYEPALEEYVAEMTRIAKEAGWDPKEYAKWADQQKLFEWETKGRKEGKKKPGPTKVPAEFNPNSYMHIRFMLFHVWKLKPIMKKGKISTDADSLDIYKDKLKDVKGIQFIDVKRAYAKDKKLYGTYVKGIWAHIDENTNRVHTTFKLHGTETGRLSSSDPNIHNIPRESKIKNIFIADDGYIMFQADYSQAELRVMAVESGDPWLKNVYISGSDLHDQMSIQLYGPNFTKEQRVRAKAVNFGIPLIS